MEIRRVPPEAAGWSAGEDLVVEQEINIPKGFEYPRHFSSDDRYAEDPVNYNRTDVLRRETESEPELPNNDVMELLTLARRIAVLDDEIESRTTERGGLAARLEKLAIKSSGNRGAGFDDLVKNVNVAPSYRRSVTDIPRFREELGDLFGIIGHEVLRGKVDIPPGLKTNDGEPITSQLILDKLSIIFIDLGINAEDQMKLLTDLKPGVHITLSKWKKVAIEIEEGRLSPDTVKAIETWAVKSVERKKAPIVIDSKD